MTDDQAKAIIAAILKVGESMKTGDAFSRRMAAKTDADFAAEAESLLIAVKKTTG